MFRPGGPLRPRSEEPSPAVRITQSSPPRPRPRPESSSPPCEPESSTRPAESSPGGSSDPCPPPPRPAESSTGVLDDGGLDDVGPELRKESSDRFSAARTPSPEKDGLPPA